MTLGDTDRQFLRQRRFWVRTWPAVGFGLLTLDAGLILWFWTGQADLFNPWVVSRNLMANPVPQSTVFLMAALFPLVFNLCLLLAAAVVILGFGVMRQERRYLAIIDRLRHDPPANP
ncbi:MAG: hypothetical protein IGQ88_03585 [Gloeomargaritaceae cyanobacterium C42_A2020_066]|nr:hypothetical protein [Gloeomargaritaceae cyanobacterium C42_A2020_066]